MFLHWFPVLDDEFIIIIKLKPHQIKSKRLLKLLTLHADTTSSGNEFHSLTICVKYEKFYVSLW